ncbi:dicarboxylate/amino acid:cation symporter [Terrilactibacillus laevilacticus]|uniref:Dicarboxylate/amino acid:cation symporter n=1 Tax=Terrilactibacillus laevilacticus TaxID=1380157 RepID=A0ABW5PV68_9BACI|nr:cation:dicarboxylase symporter family transporter [Terrilactibacillus laevilacticus]
MKKIPLGLQIFIAAILGVIVGATSKTLGLELKFLGDAFIKMIQMTIVPLIFPLVVLGISQMKSVKNLGRLAGKAILYFEIITTIIIIFSIFLANITGIGKNVNLDGGNTKLMDGISRHIDFQTFFLDIIPNNIFTAFSNGKLLPIIFFAVFVGIAMASLGAKVKPVEDGLEAISNIMFKVLNYVVKFSPIGVFGYLAFNTANYGFSGLKAIAGLIVVTYIGLLVVVFILFPIVAKIYGVKYFELLRTIGDLLLIAFTTRSSEVVLAPLTQRLEKYGAHNSVVSFVLPLGYSFNLDGGTLYLAPAILFLANAYGLDLSLIQQIEVVGLVMLLSKGMAAVASASIVVIMSAATTLGIPLEGIAMIMAVDFLMDMGRTTTNVIGNSLATIAMAKSEKKFRLKDNEINDKSVAV